MKLIGEAKPGEICYYDLVVSDEEMLHPAVLEDHLRYAKKDVQSQNVAIINVDGFRSGHDEQRGSITIRYNCIKLAEPDITKLKEFLTK